MRKPPEGRKSSFYGSPDNPGVTPGRPSRLNVFRIWRAVSLELRTPEGIFPAHTERPQTRPALVWGSIEYSEYWGTLVFA